MTTATFYKMTGSGNDFVFVDGRETSPAAWPTERIRSVCDRRRGVGADGLVILTPAEPGAVEMIYYNADGSRAAMCGNGALCAARLAARLGMASPERIEIRADSGRYMSRCVGPGWVAELLMSEVAIPEPVAVPLEPGESAAFQGTVGVPHTVLVVQDVASVDVDGRGRVLRFWPAFAPAGSNINFISRTPADAEADWAIRTYERGVEGETLACGTGTVAAALACARQGLSVLPMRIRAAGGSVFSVAGQLDGSKATDVWLCGEGRLVYIGELVS